MGSGLREGWEEKTLNEISENLDKKRIPITKNMRNAGDIPYYGASGIVDYVADYIFDEDLLCISEDGANLVARKYPIAFSISGKTWVNNHAHILKFSDFTTQKFVELYINFINLDNFISGMAQPKLNQTKLNQITIPLPPLQEQKQIVATLDKAFSAIDIAKKDAELNLQNAKELFDSYLQGVFENRGEGWEEKAWGQLIDIKSGRNQKEVIDVNGKYPIYGSAGKIMGYANSYICEERTIIIGRKGTINTPLYMQTKFWNVDTAFGLVAGDKLENKFLFYFCKNFNFKELDKGTTLPSLVKKDLVKINMQFPKITEQQKIVKKLNTLQEQTKKLESIYTQKLKNLDELKKSMLQKAFSGELI